MPPAEVGQQVKPTPTKGTPVKKNEDEAFGSMDG